MPVCHLPGADIFFAEKGGGEPVVFLGGLSGDHLYWAGQLRAFGKHFRCLALDNRDVGQSAYAAGPYTTADMAADVLGLLDHLALPPVHVVGASMGGMIAQELALAAPDRVKSLALVSTLGRADSWFRGTLTAFGLIRRQVADTAAFFEAILPWWVSHRFCEDAERVAWLTWLLRQNPHPQRLDGFLRQLDAVGRHDALGRLHGLRCPVLLLVGEDDCVAPPRFSAQLRREMPHAQLVLLPGVGHAPVVEDPGQFNARLAEFLGSQCTGAPPARRTG
jgi:pimeloyl-ACP methyl ester carboxylesterase